MSRFNQVRIAGFTGDVEGLLPPFPMPFELVNVFLSFANAGAADVVPIVFVRSGGILQRLLCGPEIPLGQGDTPINFDQGATTANFDAGPVARASLPQELIISEAERVSVGILPMDTTITISAVIFTIRFLPTPGRKPRKPPSDPIPD